MRLRLSVLLLLVLVPGLGYALGLGKLELKSALNEPFEARLELLSATVEELDSLNVRLADEAAFRRAGIPRPQVLSELNFATKETESGPDYIRVYSNDPIREPFLNFLLEISWAKGRLYREYTVLLDPPIYATPEKQKQLSAPVTPAASATGVIKRETEENQVVYNPEYKGAKGPAPSAGPVAVTRRVDYSGGDYGPAVAGDTLWSVASAMRPDTSISVQQMMFALLRANPEAFINNNINGLKRGHILKLPALQDIQTLDQDQAFAEAKMQNSLWEEARGSVAAAVTPRPEGAPAAETTAAPAIEAAPATPPSGVSEEAPPPAAPQGEPELRLVAPAAEGESPAPGAGGADQKALTQELALANESLEALKLENLELKDKLSETDAIVDDLKRLIVLKENDLAALQQRIAEQEAAKAQAQQPAAPATAPEPVEPAAETAPVPAEPAEAKTTEETPVETAPEPGKEAEATPAESVEPADTGVSSLIPPAISGIIELIRANILVIGGGLAGLVLLVLISRVIKRRQGTAIEIPQSAFPEFDDMQPGAAASEDVTDINPELEESEAPTILPGSEDETIAPEFGGDATRAAAPPAKRTPAAPVPAPAPAPAVEEEDPLAEVNVFLAYEHFDQAEEFVKKAIAREPNNLEFHTKLLEVYYAANNKKGYEKAARVLHDKVKGQGSYWDMAVTMWQEISPGRALFAEPLADEEDTGVAASTPGGGIVNIAAGEGAGPAGLDFDLDTTAGGELMDVATAGGDEADVLDVTAAVNIEDEEAILDMTAAVDTGASSAEADEELSLELPADDAALDFSFDLEKSEPAAEEVSADALDLSFDVGAEEDTAEKGDDNALDISFDLSMPGGEAAVSAETPAADDNSLDFSFDLEKSEPAAEEVSADALDLSFDVGTGQESTGSLATATEADSNALDFSFDLDMEPPAKAATPAATPAQGGDDMDLLDVTAAVSLDDSGDGSVQAGGATGEDLLNVSGAAAAGDDLLDVTKSSQFDLDNEQDLLDVTAAAGAGMDADELLNLGKKSQPEAAAEDASDSLDFELAPDSAADDNSLSIDMDSTMQIPSKGTMRSGADTGGLELVIDEEDSDDRTIMVPRTKDAAEQSADDEIASQLDLAKAYVELGNTAEAKTILDEVIAIGNAQQRQQAQEILGQI